MTGGESAASRKLERQRNRIRGVIGTVSQTGRARPSDPRKALRLGVRKALLVARRELSDEEAEVFFRWFDNAGRTIAGDLRTVSAFGLVNPLIKGQSRSFAKEIGWLVRRLSHYKPELRQFRALVEELNAAFWRDNRPGVEGILAEIERLYGHSIWLIELNLAVSQMYHGLDAQKELLEDIKSNQYPGGIPAYIAHFVSIRNEERSTIKLYRDDVVDRVDRTTLFDDARIYLKYKLADRFAGTQSELSSILHVEQSQSIIDLYETTVDLMQKLVRLNKARRYEKSIRQFLDALGDVGDYRLARLDIAMGGARAIEEPPRSQRVLLPFLRGCADQALEIAFEQVAAESTDAWAGIHLAAAQACGHGSSTCPQPWDRIVRPLSSVLSRDEDFEGALGALEKFARNFRSLPTAAALGDFTAAITSVGAAPEGSAAITALNNPLQGPEELLFAGNDSQFDEVRAALERHYPEEVLQFWSGEGRADDQRSWMRAAVAYVAGSRAGASAEDVRHLLEGFDQPTMPAPVRGLVSNYRIRSALVSGERNAALLDLASEAALAPSVRPILPAEEVLGGRDWEDLASIPHKLDLAIGLDVLWRQSNDDLHGTHLRFAFEDYLSERENIRPSELIGRGENVDARFIYFLRYICVPEVMDLSGLFEGTDELVSERTTLCRQLVDLDPLHADVYISEAQDIKRRILIQEGLKIVDNSRVHVDTVALSRWAERRYGESFARYRSLRSAGIGLSDDFDEVIRKALRETSSTGEYFSIPTNEADQLLLEIVLALKNEFLNNTEHGLQFYLGKRIRHGTIGGHLRGPLENRGLISERTLTGEYKANDVWLPLLAYPCAEDEQICLAAFSEFAREYDEIIRKIKDVKMQVKSKERQEGVFDIVVTSVSYHIIRGIVQESLTFESFLAACYAIFWALLNPSLDAARRLIGVEEKARAVQLFERLHGELRAHTVPNDAYHQLTTAIRDTSNEVQRQFDAMAEWLKRTEVQQASHMFEMSEIIDIALQSALKTHKSFDPRIRKTVCSEIEGPASLLVVLSDVVFVVIDNVCRRAQCGASPAVTIECGFDAERSAIELRFVNPVGERVDREDVESRLADIREKIRCGDIHAGALGDQGSGLLKIASIASVEAGGDVQFGFDGEDFFTSVRLPVLLEGARVILASDRVVK